MDHIVDRFRYRVNNYTAFYGQSDRDLDRLILSEIDRLNRKLDEADKIVARLGSQKADAEAELANYIKHCRCNDP